MTRLYVIWLIIKSRLEAMLSNMTEDSRLRQCEELATWFLVFSLRGHLSFSTPSWGVFYHLRFQYGVHEHCWLFLLFLMPWSDLGEVILKKECSTLRMFPRECWVQLITQLNSTVYCFFLSLCLWFRWSCIPYVTCSSREKKIYIYIYNHSFSRKNNYFQC
jgi:hypothetical protein